MMLLCYHGIVPLQHLCDIGAVTVRFLCNLTETHLAINKTVWRESRRSWRVLGDVTFNLNHCLS